MTEGVCGRLVYGNATVCGHSWFWLFNILMGRSVICKLHCIINILLVLMVYYSVYAWVEFIGREGVLLTQYASLDLNRGHRGDAPLVGLEIWMQPRPKWPCPLNGVLWPSGLARWTQVLVLSECGFESRPGRSWCLCPRHLTIKAVGPVGCVMHVKEPRTLIVKEKGLAPVFLEWQQNAPKLFLYKLFLSYIKDLDTDHNC